MTRRPVWPALAQIAEVPLGMLGCELGIWGKVPGAASEFRWIARTPLFGRGVADLDRRVRIGTENRPRQAVFWRCLDGRHFALGVYPSRARDAANRGGFMEKQVLHWTGDEVHMPAALAALLLLPRVAALDDALWWGRVGEGYWEQRDYALPLAADLVPNIRIDEDTIASAVTSGIEALHEVADAEHLVRLYAAILAAERPSVLCGIAAPLPPAAVGALLLPLPAELAERLSIGGWIPSSSVDKSDLAANWDVLATHRLAPLSPAAEAHRRDASTLAHALLAGDPTRLSMSPGAVVPVPVTPTAGAIGKATIPEEQTVQGTEGGTAEGPLPAKETPRNRATFDAATEESAVPACGTKRVDALGRPESPCGTRTSTIPAPKHEAGAAMETNATPRHRSQPYGESSAIMDRNLSAGYGESGGESATGAAERSTRSEAAKPVEAWPNASPAAERASPRLPDPRLALTAPSNDSSPVLWELYEQASRVNRRRIDLERVARILDEPDSYPLLSEAEDPRDCVLIDWIGELDEYRPDWVDREQWDLKIDQLRAAALFLLPHPATLELIGGVPRSNAVPALLFTSALPPERAASRLTAHGTAALHAMIEQSSRCPDPGQRSEIERWLRASYLLP